MQTDPTNPAHADLIAQREANRARMLVIQQSGVQPNLIVLRIEALVEHLFGEDSDTRLAFETEFEAYITQALEQTEQAIAEHIAAAEAEQRTAALLAPLQPPAPVARDLNRSERRRLHRAAATAEV